MFPCIQLEQIINKQIIEYKTKGSQTKVIVNHENLKHCQLGPLTGSPNGMAVNSFKGQHYATFPHSSIKCVFGFAL